MKDSQMLFWQAAIMAAVCIGTASYFVISMEGSCSGWLLGLGTFVIMGLLMSGVFFGTLGLGFLSLLFEKFAPDDEDKSADRNHQD